MPAYYTPLQYANMHLIYGECHGNANAAARLYRERYPNEERYPDYRVFIYVHRSYTEGVIPGRQVNRDAGNILGPDDEEEVLACVEESPDISVRAIERQIGIPKTVVHRILRVHRYHPYHLQRVQTLLPRDHAPRVLFCQRMLERHAADPDFLSKILWTDESTFKKDNFMNMHNLHCWSLANPHAIREDRSQYQFKINLWCGIINGQVVGPIEIPGAFNGQHYLELLRDELNGLLEDVPLATRQGMWLQNDGCPAHYARPVRDYLDEEFPGRWIGRLGPILWPARSPDLNPMDFFYWGFLKENVYFKPIETVENLRDRINGAAETCNRLHKARFVTRSFIRRCRTCIRAGGAQFEHLL